MRLSPAFFYGAHQIFTKLVPDRIGEGLGGFVVEAIAAISILPYLAFPWLTSRWSQQSSAQGILYSVLTGICISGKTIAFFLLFQKAGPLSGVPQFWLAVGQSWPSPAFLFFREPPSWQRIVGVGFAIIWLVIVAQMEIDSCSFRKELQSYVSHRMCVADNIASTGKEKVEVFVELPTAADIERQLGTAITFFG